MRDSRLTGLDFLRALACLMVFGQHTFQRLNPAALGGAWSALYRFFNFGDFGVAIFFLLSGFLLSRPFWLAYDAGAPMPSLRTYALRRAARIVPGFYLALVVSFIVAATIFAVPTGADTVERLVLGFLFLGEFSWNTLFPVDVNGPLWSIGMEVASYVLLPLGLVALFALRRHLPAWRGRLVFVGIAALALLGQALIVTYWPKATDGVGFDHGFLGGAKYWMPRFNVVGFFAVFALGGLAAGLSTLRKGPPHAAADLLVLAGLAGAGLAIWSIPLSGQSEAFGWIGMPYSFPWFHLGIGTTLVAFPHAQLLPALTERAPIRYLAKISFGFYLWHFLLLELIRQLVAPGYYYGNVSDLTYWSELTAGGFVAAIAVASLSWHGLEAPALAWARRLERPGPRFALAQAPPQKMQA